MNDRIIVAAQVGCGAFAAAQDMPNYDRSNQAKCKWCCDTNLDNAKQLAATHGVPNVTDDPSVIMADPEVDMIKIATTHEAHLPIITAAADAGKHMFCEKPMAMTTGEALKMASIIQDSGIKLCVDYNRRMAPSLHALKKRWQDHNANPTHNPWRYTECDRELTDEESHSHLLIRVQDDSASYRVSHLDPVRGGGQIIGESVHWLDLACWLFDTQSPVEIQAWGSTTFSHGINLSFSDGDSTTILFNCEGTMDFPKELYEITCKGALFRNEFFVENQYFGVPGEERETFPLQRDPLPDIGTEGGIAGYMAKYAARVEGLANSKDGYSILTVDKGHSGMFDAFVEAIINDTSSPCDEQAGYTATLLARLAIQSISDRKTVRISDTELMAGTSQPWK